MNPTTYPRPVLSEQQRDMLASLGLTHRTTDLAIIVEHPDQTETRLDVADFDVWLRGYLEGRGWRGEAIAHADAGQVRERRMSE